jgi:hypothetical protein
MQRSKRVLKFLELAEGHKAGIADTPLDDAEKLKILGRPATVLSGIKSDGYGQFTNTAIYQHVIALSSHLRRTS